VVGDAPRLERVAVTDAHEGPVYVTEEDALYFTTVPRDGVVAIKRLNLRDGIVDVIRADANGANGMTFDPSGALLVCEQGSFEQRAAITRIDLATHSVSTVVDDWRGLALNSPNDVVVRGSDGTIWFTDPSYGRLQGFRPEPESGDHVYRYDPATGRLDVVADGLDKPNGLAFSPDEAILYVGDSGANQEPGSFHPERPHHVIAYQVAERRLAVPRLLCVTNPGFPDGIKVDSAGRVYASSFSGVQVFDPAGELIGEIALPGAVNFAWGGRDRNLLFITADTAVWCAHLAATGP
jgi:gluconolactonase